MTRKLKMMTSIFLALMLCVSLGKGMFADEEVLDFELLDVKFSCRTDFFQYISENEAIFDLASFIQDLGYIRETGEETPTNESFIFSNPEHTLKVELDEEISDEGFKIIRSIQYGKTEYSTLCTFEREDRYDGSTLYSVNTADNYTVSMDQILLLTYIMENLNDNNLDPLNNLYYEYYDSGIYKFPV